MRAILERKDDHCRNLELQLQDMKNDFPLASSPVSTSADAKKIESLQQTIERKDAQIRDLQATLARRQNTLKTSLESAVQKSRVVARNGLTKDSIFDESVCNYLSAIQFPHENQRNFKDC